jgi:hypothetical protein
MGLRMGLHTTTRVAVGLVSASIVSKADTTAIEITLELFPYPSSHVTLLRPHNGDVETFRM